MIPCIPVDNPDALPEDHSKVAFNEADNFDAQLEKRAKRGRFLPDEVVQADLTKYTLKALEGRLAYYTKEALFERNGRIAAENRNEAERTKTEIDRRKIYERAEANRVFAL
jgi:hypothetical protein